MIGLDIMTILRCIYVPSGEFMAELKVAVNGWMVNYEIAGKVKYKGVYKVFCVKCICGEYIRVLFECLYSFLFCCY